MLFATTVAHMSDGTHLTTWVTRETKERFAAVARHQGLSDSGLLKRLVELRLQGAGAAEVRTPGDRERASRGSRLTVSIRPDDQLLLRERAAARGMATATYVARQRVRRAVVEVGQVRRGLSACLRLCGSGQGWDRKISCLLQRPASAHGA